MKRFICLIAMILLLAGFCHTGLAEAPAAAVPGQIILYTCYRQVGWGDRVQIGCVDADGCLWLLTGYDSTLQWPYETEAQLEYLQAAHGMEPVGQLNPEEVFDLKSLVISTEDQGHASQPAANDAGTESSYAVQYDPEEQAHVILLGMSGDDCFENFDPNAQALYQTLRRLFPQVTCYGGNMGPEGFQPVPIRTFCGMEQLDLDSLTVSAVYMDCEAGPRELIVSEEEHQYLFNLIRHGKVTGKANATLTTGGTTCYDFSDPSGRFLASLELYQGLLVRSDGMYTITNDHDAPPEKHETTEESAVPGGQNTAKVSPLPVDINSLDFSNGSFNVQIEDIDQIVHNHSLTFSLYLEDCYDPDQIKNLSPGDTILVAGAMYTVKDISIRDDRWFEDDPESLICEIETEEEDWEGIHFLQLSDGFFIANVGDWTPVTFVGRITIPLPLPASFVYYDYPGGEEPETGTEKDLLNDLQEGSPRFFSPYNTSIFLRDGELLELHNRSYPWGPEPEE